MNPIQLWWRLVRFRPGLYTLINLFYIGYTLSLAFSGLLLRAFFDHLVDEPGSWTLFAIILLQIGSTLLAAVGLGGANANGFYLHGHSIRALLFGNVFGHILAQPGAQPLPANLDSANLESGEEMSVGVALNTLRDDIGQIRWFDIELMDLFGFGLTTIIALVAMFQVSVPITLGVFAPLIAIIVVTKRLSGRIERYREASREATGQATGAIGEIFGAVQAIQVNNAEARMIAHFRQLNEARRETNVRDQLLTRLVDALSENMVVIGTALVLILGARSMQAGEFTVGDFALFVAYIWPVTILFQNIGSQIAIYQQTGVSIRRLQSLMQGAPSTQLAAHEPVYLTGPLPTIPAVIKTPADHLESLEVRNLTYRHPQSQAGIEGINLCIERGSLTVITGPIGSGKTTLLRVLLGLLPKEGGEIYWNDQAVEDAANFFVPPRAAYTPQTPHLFSESLRDNILLGSTVPEPNLHQAIEQAVLTPDIATMSQGLATHIGLRGMRLSGGQMQRTAAARVFVRNPELLVFDDISSALDMETERLLWERLFPSSVRGSEFQNKKTENAGTTCLVVSHRPSVLQRADQVLALQDGRLENLFPGKL